MQRFTEHTTTDEDALLAHIRQARQQGWCLVNQELEEGLISIAAPLTNRTGQTVAALNISGQANRTSAAVMQEDLLPALLSGGPDHLAHDGGAEGVTDNGCRQPAPEITHRNERPVLKLRLPSYVDRARTGAATPVTRHGG